MRVNLRTVSSDVEFIEIFERIAGFVMSSGVYAEIVLFAVFVNLIECVFGYFVVCGPICKTVSPGTFTGKILQAVAATDQP